MSRDREKLQRMAKELESEARKVGLKINPKNAILISNQNAQPEIILTNNKIWDENSIIYLGQEIAFEKNIDCELSCIRALAWKNFWSFRQIYKSKMPTPTKRKIFESPTLPVLTYGAQTWATHRHSSPI